TDDALLKRFEELSVWRQGDLRAPHKPLLVLYALGRWQRGLTEVSFREAEPELTALLREFGPPRRSDHPEQPFWRLQRARGRALHAAAGPAAEGGGPHPRGGRPGVAGGPGGVPPRRSRRRSGPTRPWPPPSPGDCWSNTSPSRCTRTSSTRSG